MSEMALGTKKNNSLFFIKLFTFIGLISLFLADPAGLHALNEIPFELPGKQELSKLKTAVIFTNKGEIRIELFPDEAPWHVANLKYLSDKGFYKNLPFHVHIVDYIIQGGDPTGTGKGGPGYSLPPEFNSRPHEEGTFGMARLADVKNPERRSNGSQFHILMKPNIKMNGEYTILGQVVSGMSVVRSLRKGDKIEDLIVYVRK